MSSDNVLLGTGALLVVNTGMLIGTVCFPFAASLLLDGIVQILRGDGPKVFQVALARVVVLAVGDTCCGGSEIATPEWTPGASP